MKVAIRALKRRSPLAIVVALPVAPPETVAELSHEANRVVCLAQPLHFRALSYYYRNFEQLDDNDVLVALEHSQAGRDIATNKSRKAATGSSVTGYVKKKR
jgi:putative phosphoribosyl transferase